ncbi:hypothetical protein HCN44_007188 [Aphidius gifuensis]|uniref:Protein kinase domain-containing protein n=1 Tax=Aphidius gifuensis TaxID=684658 RepID=A0A835CP75_APHGI|nr:hypothetical protein HCN44_007188 [Aphidius gifuensis]
MRKLYQYAETATSYSVVGNTLGGPYAYMPPKMITHRQKKTTNASDIRAFGCTVLEIYNEKILFSNDLDAVEKMHQQDISFQATKVPEAIRETVISCFSHEPGERPKCELLYNFCDLKKNEWKSKEKIREVAIREKSEEWLSGLEINRNSEITAYEIQEHKKINEAERKENQVGVEEIDKEIHQERPEHEEEIEQQDEVNQEVDEEIDGEVHQERPKHEDKIEQEQHEVSQEVDEEIDGKVHQERPEHEEEIEQEQQDEVNKEVDEEIEQRERREEEVNQERAEEMIQQECPGQRAKNQAIRQQGIPNHATNMNIFTSRNLQLDNAALLDIEKWWLQKPTV